MPTLGVEFLFVLLVARGCMSTHEQTCGGLMTSQYVRIPAALPLQDFDRLIVEKTMQEVYFAIPKPPAFLPDINYNAVIMKSATLSGRYYSVSEGESPTVNPQCARGNVSMQLIPGATTARFIRNPDNPTQLQVMWSSCPGKYIWSLRCTHGRLLTITRCPINATSLGIYVHQTSMDDLPLDDIMQDLCATDVRFAAENFKWFYSFGPNTLC